MMPRKPENRRNTDSSRRSFVKNSALAAAGFMIVPRHVLGGKDFRAPSDRLIIASVGAGGKGNDDINRFYKSGKADIGFLCDVDDRRCAGTVKQFPQAKRYRDWRELFDKESKNFDAVSVSTPDHTHAIVGMGAMQLGKHTWIQKPMAHDIYEARELTKAAARYKVVTQMGNQGASGDGVRQMKEWFEAGLLGDVHTIEIWTNRPIWPQGIPWPSEKPPVPKGLDWDLWVGTAPYKDYVDKLIPQAWRGWWDYGTGALGDLGCHLMEAPFNILNLKYAKDVQATVGSVYSDWGKRVNAPDSPPPSAHATLTFPKTNKTKGEVTMHWMDGGIRPMRPVELGNDELFGDGMSGVLFIGTKGKMMASEMAQNARLLPLSKNQTVKLKQTIKRVPGGMDGHYAQWVEGAIAGYGKTEMSASFDKSGPLTEAILMANLAIRGAAIYHPGKQTDPFDQSINYPGANKKLIWDNANMRITNYDVVNQFVKREYRKGWSLGV